MTVVASAVRDALGDALVRPGRVVVHLVFSQDGTQMAFPEDQHARRGGMAILPQDIPGDVVAEVVSWVKTRDTVVDTALTLSPSATVGEALNLLPKRAHGTIVVVNGSGEPVGVVTEADCAGVDRFAQLHTVMTPDPFILPSGTPPARAFELLHEGRHRAAPVVTSSGVCAGIMTLVGALRATLYKPAVDASGQLRVGAAEDAECTGKEG